MYIWNPRPRMLVIARPKHDGAGEHWGVLLPSNWVAHNTPERGEHISPLTEFAPNGYRIIREVPPERLHDSLWRIRAAVQSPTARGAYHATKNNCQTFANRVTGEVPRSPAVEGVGLLALAGLFVYALARAE